MKIKFFLFLILILFTSDSIKAQFNTEYKLLIEKANKEITAKNYTQARKYISEIDSNAFKPNQLEKGFYYQQLARLAYYDTYEDAKSVAYYYKAIKIYEYNNSNVDLGIAYSNVVGVLTDLKRYKEAEVAINKSIIYVKNDKIKYGNALINYSRLLESTGDYPKSISLSLKALKLYEESGNLAKIGSGNFQTGLVLETAKQFDKAIEYYQKALSIRKTLKDSLGMSNVYNNLGIIYKNRKQYDLALSSYQNAYNLAIQMNRQVLSLNPLINIGVVYNKQNKNILAIKNYEDALIIANKFNRQNSIKIIETNLALLYMNEEQYEKALPFAQKAYNYGETDGTLEEKMAFNFNLAEVLDGLNRSKEAFPYMQRAIKFKDSLNNSQSSENIAEMLTKFETEKKEQQILLLAKENNLQKLSIENQDLMLNQRALEIDNRGISINLKNREIESQKLKTTQQQQQIKLLAKEKEIRDLEINKKNIYLAIGAFSILILGVTSFQFYKKRQLNELNRMQNEKLRISQELHDNIGAQLSFINSSIGTMSANDKENIQLKETQIITQNTIRELRSTVWLINQQEFSLDEFVVKLRDYVKPYHTGKPHINIEDLSNGNIILKPITATNLFRVIQEVVNNAIKHADATLLNIFFKNNNQELELLITDNGKGFERNGKANGYGLKNINSRIQNINGKCLIESKIGEGTQVKLNIPV
jgi:signal transduction histidine kinase